MSTSEIPCKAKFTVIFFQIFLNGDRIFSFYLTYICMELTLTSVHVFSCSLLKPYATFVEWEHTEFLRCLGVVLFTFQQGLKQQIGSFKENTDQCIYWMN